MMLNLSFFLFLWTVWKFFEIVVNYPENIEEIRKFAKKNGIGVKYLLGEKYEGYLNLSFVKSLPDNIVFIVDGSLDLTSVKSLPDNIVFNVGGSMWLSSVRSLSSNIVFNVGGKIYLPIKHKVKVIW